MLHPDRSSCGLHISVQVIFVEASLCLSGFVRQVRKNTAAAAIKTRDWTIAISSCDTVLGMDPNCTKSLYRRALANWHLGEVEKANADLEAILKKPVTDYNMIAEASEVRPALCPVAAASYGSHAGHNDGRGRN